MNALETFGEGTLGVRDAVLRAVRHERLRQDAKFGEQNLPDAVWSMVLGEEVGEVCQAALEHGRGAVGLEALREELLQVAAVAVAWIEAIERR